MKRGPRVRRILVFLRGVCGVEVKLNLSVNRDLKNTKGRNDYCGSLHSVVLVFLVLSRKRKENEGRMKGRLVID